MQHNKETANKEGNQHAFRKATLNDVSAIWTILQGAIALRKSEGSDQWQDGYPNEKVVLNDIEKEHGYVFMQSGSIIGYVALIINFDPDFEHIIGKWLSHDHFVVFHRMAIAKDYLQKGYAFQMMKCIEEFAENNSIPSIKADTAYDNLGMLRLFERFNYTFCGEIHRRGNSPRKAFEKLRIK